MHIMEGYLDPWWCLFWTMLSAPFLVYGFYTIRRLIREDPAQKTLLALSGAFIFVLSSFKLPSVTGSSSHPTGTGFSTMFFGVGVTSVMSFIVLIFQALLLAHGGITTMGANVFSMGVAGPFVAYMAFKTMSKAGIRTPITVFITVFLAGIMTYVTTAVQLALAYGTFSESLVSFLSVFAVTQIPLGIVEGILFTIFVDYLQRARPDLTDRVFPRRVTDES
ncbi:MAG TPA: energy-coupling factor ABC transporter permease [Methanomassiliicoccales archaeon]|nr:energy-coupling factor ABC transporter permease [Methanomassiliicoccales archaeon]